MIKKKILLIMHDINYGGAAKMFAFLSNGLCEIGNDVYVYTYEGLEPNYPLKIDVNYIPAKIIPHNLLFKRLLPFVSVRKTVKMVKPDVVISFLPNANLYSILGTSFTKIPVIITERSDPFNEKGALLEIKRYFFRFADGAVFQTEGARNYYCKRLIDRSVVIPNPVTTCYHPLVSYNNRIDEVVFVARFYIKQKRQDIMVLAFKKVLEKYPNLKLVFCGEGEDIPKIVDMVAKEGITHNVIFEGKVINVRKRIEKAKVFVLTSDYEGIPNALIEAMVSGLPVVSTDCSPGGARLLIEHKKNGLIVPTGDVDSIADAIVFLLDNPEIAEQLGNEAQKIIEKYSPIRITKMWDEFIDSVVYD